MNSESNINYFKNHGFNILLTTPVNKIPDNIFNFSENQKKKSLSLLGSGGSGLWDLLPKNTSLNPLDDYTISVINNFRIQNLESDVEILFPNDNLLVPLQQISRYLNFSHQSPIGLDISLDYGLWFSFRGLFLTNKAITGPMHSSHISICDSCLSRPCLTNKNINQARILCPIKKEHQYKESQLSYNEEIIRKMQLI
jgi:hypothetical protein